MPLDEITGRFDPVPAPVKVRRGDLMQRLGLKPVPTRQVEAHKWKIRQDYADHPRAMWDQMYLPGGPIRSVLTRLGDILVVFTNDRSAPPESLIQLAERIEQDGEQVAFEVEYFYTDPILNVIFEFDPRRMTFTRKATLGIWDNGQLVAIAASYDPDAPTMLDRLRRMFRL